MSPPRFEPVTSQNVTVGVTFFGFSFGAFGAQNSEGRSATLTRFRSFPQSFPYKCWGWRFGARIGCCCTQRVFKKIPKLLFDTAWRMRHYINNTAITSGPTSHAITRYLHVRVTGRLYKVHPTIGRDAPVGQYRNSSPLSLTSVLDCFGLSIPHPGRFAPA